MKLTIEKVSNGWIVHDDMEPETPMMLVFEESADTETASFARLLDYILEQLGPSNSRHSKERIYIEIRPGDKA